MLETRLLIYWVKDYNTVIRQSIRVAGPVRVRGMGSVHSRVSPARRERGKAGFFDSASRRSE